MSFIEYLINLNPVHDYDHVILNKKFPSYSLAVYFCTIYFVPLHGLGFHEIPSVKILTLSLSYSSFNTNLHIETNGINFKRIIRANKILFL